MSEIDGWGQDVSDLYRNIAPIAVPARAEQMAALLTLIPFTLDDAFYAVELASGEGRLSDALLRTFPRATVLALDGEESMRRATAARLSRHSGRGKVSAFDIMSTEWHPLLDGVDCVLSSLCVHHLDGAQKQTLFNAAHQRTSERSALLLADLVMPARAEAAELFAATWDQSARQQSLTEVGDESLFGAFTRLEWNFYRYPDPFDKPDRLFDQLLWLRAAGYDVVDCFWMQAGHAVYGGYKRSSPPEGARVTFEMALDAARAALSE
jgi:hypothetical protein